MATVSGGVRSSPGRARTTIAVFEVCVQARDQNYRLLCLPERVLMGLNKSIHFQEINEIHSQLNRRRDGSDFSIFPPVLFLKPTLIELGSSLEKANSLPVKSDADLVKLYISHYLAHPDVSP